MLRRRIRRRHPRLNAVYRPIPAKKKKQLIFLAVILLLFITVFISARRLWPIVASLAMAEITDVVNYAVNESIDAEIKNGDLDYSKLVTLEKDASGNITAVTTNMALIDTLQTSIMNGILDNVQELIPMDIKIPIGNVVGPTLFSGHGPSIPVRVLSIADEDIEFSSDFSSAGINQTRHQIFIDVSVVISILTPGGRDTTTVVTRVTVAETVIVGTVPDFYANFGQ